MFPFQIHSHSGLQHICESVLILFCFVLFYVFTFMFQTPVNMVDLFFQQKKLKKHYDSVKRYVMCSVNCMEAEGSWAWGSRSIQLERCLLIVWHVFEWDPFSFFCEDSVAYIRHKILSKYHNQEIILLANCLWKSPSFSESW